MAMAAITATAGDRYNFNAEWLMKVGDNSSASKQKFNDRNWQEVTLPYAFNQTEAFARPINKLSDTVVWYRKYFVLPAKLQKGTRFFIEFEGVRFGAQVFLNGKEVGRSDNGVMAFGFDLTPYINKKGENVLAVRVDNSWTYREPSADGKPGSRFQWNDKNFYCNYGGINKNVWLHVMGDVYQTLPLYSSLKTTGIYVYATEHDVAAKKAVIHAESQVANTSKKNRTIAYRVTLREADSKRVIASFDGDKTTVKAGETATLSASKEVDGLHFWSWGYGFLYDVETQLLIDGKEADKAVTRTGFRKTDFNRGMVTLNDRVLHLKGFAQRSTNEWPAVGISIPAWMSDFSNRLILECNGNLVRWMHVTPMKQDIESFDRLGLIQAMPAGDAEKDVTDRRWQQRKEVMRDAIIYNRNSPSILFYECGNNQISEEHMAEMKSIRDQYDPLGGRAIGSRNMLDSREAEYGGEMLYINRSATKPMWQMEYCRDEGIRRYWDEWSWPYHKEGDGPLYRGARAVSYNHNQDGLAVENVVRWNEYWMARPGQGTRVNSGGAKIIFADSNTHYRGEKNYRTSGDVDAMRLPKDSWYAHQVMWDGWVDTEREHTYIIGHWNYDEGTRKPVYVVSTADEVELVINGRLMGKGKRSDTFLFTFDNVKFEAGRIEAVGRKAGKTVSRHAINTAGEPAALSMHWVETPQAFRADGSDIRIAEIEVVDLQGRRCPLAHNMIDFTLQGEAEWLGGLSGDGADSLDNRVLSKQLAVEAGVCRVMVRSTTVAGDITITAATQGMADAVLTTHSVATPTHYGFYTDADGQPIEAAWQKTLPPYLLRGETPPTPSYKQQFTAVPIMDVTAGSNQQDAILAYDDNEASTWSSNEEIADAWMTFRLSHAAKVRQVAIRLQDFRKTSYPLEISTEDGTVVWSGYTPKTLGNCYLEIDNPVESSTYTIKMIGAATIKEAFGDMTELAARKAVSTKPSKSNRLRIIEVEFNE